MRVPPLPLCVGLLWVALSVAGCGADPTCLGRVAPAPDGAFAVVVGQGEGERLVRYRDGREVRVPARLNRIASTLPGLTATVAMLGASDRLAAISGHCADPGGRDDVHRISVMPLDLESLVALRVDLLLVDDVLRPPGLDGVATTGGPPVLFLESRSLAHLRTSVDVLAALLATEDAADAARDFGGRLDAALLVAGQAARQPPISVLLLAEAEPLYVLGPGSLLDDMVRACGATNIACDLGRASGPFAEELALARHPVRVIGLAGALPTALSRRWAAILKRPRSRLEVRDPTPFVQAGPDTPEALRALADFLRERRRDEGAR